MRRLALFGACLVTCAALLSFGAPAQAALHPVVEPKLDAPVDRDYPPIPGQYSGGQIPVYPDPADCATAFTAVCDTIPVKINPPDLPDTDDWTVSFAISWDDPEELNDVDFILFDNKQVAGDGTYTLIDNSGASSANPEKIAMFEPELVDYNLVVINFSGVNLGYHLRAEMLNVAFTGAFELLAPSFRFRNSGDNDEDVVVEDLSGEEEAAAPFDFSAVPENTPGAPIAPTFGEVAAVADPAFEQFPPTDFTEELKAPQVPRVGAADLPPLKDVSAAVAAFWLGAVPIALLAGLAVLLLRRSRTSFALAGL